MKKHLLPWATVLVAVTLAVSSVAVYAQPTVTEDKYISPFTGRADYWKKMYDLSPGIMLGVNPGSFTFEKNYKEPYVDGELAIRYEWPGYQEAFHARVSVKDCVARKGIVTIIWDPSYTGHRSEHAQWVLGGDDTYRDGTAEILCEEYFYQVKTGLIK